MGILTNGYYSRGRKTGSEISALTGMAIGDTVFNTDTEERLIYDGYNWISGSIISLKSKGSPIVGSQINGSLSKIAAAEGDFTGEDYSITDSISNFNDLFFNIPPVTNIGSLQGYTNANQVISIDSFPRIRYSGISIVSKSSSSATRGQFLQLSPTYGRGLATISDTGLYGNIGLWTENTAELTNGRALISFRGTVDYVPATGDYRTALDGPWTTLTTWERYNGSTWVTPTALQGTPTNTGVRVSVSNAVTISTSLNISNVLIVSSGKITILTGGAPNVTNNGADFGANLVVNGILRRESSSTSITFGAGANMLMNGTYEHAIPAGGGSIPTALWSPSSLLSILNTGTNTSPTNLNQQFGSILYNRTSQPAGACVVTIPNAIGNFNIRSTGSLGGWITFNNTAGSTATLNYGTLQIETGTTALADQPRLDVANLGTVELNIDYFFRMGENSVVNLNNGNSSSSYVNLTSFGDIYFTRGTFSFAATSASGFGRVIFGKNIYLGLFSNQSLPTSPFTISGFLTNGSGFLASGFIKDQSVYIGRVSTGGIASFGRFSYKTVGGPSSISEIYLKKETANVRIISGSSWAGGLTVGYSEWPTTGNLIQNVTINLDTSTDFIEMTANKTIGNLLTLSSGRIRLGSFNITMPSITSESISTPNRTNTDRETSYIEAEGTGRLIRSLINMPVDLFWRYLIYPIGTSAGSSYIEWQGSDITISSGATLGMRVVPSTPPGITVDGTFGRLNTYWDFALTGTMTPVSPSSLQQGLRLYPPLSRIIRRTSPSIGATADILPVIRRTVATNQWVKGSTSTWDEARVQFTSVFDGTTNSTLGANGYISGLSDEGTVASIVI